MNPPIFFQRVEKIGAGALRLPHGGRRSELGNETEDLKKSVGEFFIVGIVERLGGVVASALSSRVADGFLREGQYAFPERGVFFVIGADLLETLRHDAAERAAHRAAEIQLKGDRHMDQRTVPRAQLRPAAVDLTVPPCAEGRMLRHAELFYHALAPRNLFTDEAPISPHCRGQFPRRPLLVFQSRIMVGKDLHRQRINGKTVRGKRLLRRGEKRFPKSRLHRPKLHRPLCLRHLADILGVGGLRIHNRLALKISHGCLLWGQNRQ